MRFWFRTLRFTYIYVFFSIALGIFLLYVSSRSLSTIERSLYPQISELFDMMNHFLGFLLFDFLILSALLGLYNVQISKRIVLIYFMISVVWGVTCESVQLLDPTRDFQLIDLIANTSPAIVVFFSLKKHLLSREKMKNKL
jgi:VanZ family protein